MPDKKSPKNDNEEEKSGGSKRMLTAGVMSVAMLGGGYFIGGMMSGGEEAAPAAEAAPEEDIVEEKAELGDLKSMEAVNVNLQEGHFLRVAVTLEVVHEEKEDSGGGGHGAEEEEEEVFPTAPAADLVLSTFSGRSMDELATAAGRNAARETLLDAIVEIYGEKVSSLYFTEFVMQ